MYTIGPMVLTMAPRNSTTAVRVVRSFVTTLLVSLYYQRRIEESARTLAVLDVDG